MPHGPPISSCFRHFVRSTSQAHRQADTWRVNQLNIVVFQAATL
jgi:hypothetical protein